MFPSSFLLNGSNLVKATFKFVVLSVAIVINLIVRFDLACQFLSPKQGEKGPIVYISFVFANFPCHYFE